MKAHKIDKTGEVKIIDISRRYLIDIFEIHNRDLRPIFLSKQVTTILVRSNCIIVNFGAVKLITGTDFAFIFNTEADLIADLFVKELENKINQDMATQSYPFEFAVLESALNNRFNQLIKDYQAIEKKIKHILEALKHNSNDDVLEKFLNIKKKISQIETRVQETQSAISDILEDDDEMKTLCLSVHEEDINEIESILENYFEQIEDISNKIVELKEHINNTQEVITLKLSSIRNNIIKLDMVISIIMMALSFSTIITGIYGMNVTNNLEKSHLAFYLILLGLATSGILIFLLAYLYLKKKKIL